MGRTARMAKRAAVALTAAVTAVASGPACAGQAEPRAVADATASPTPAPAPRHPAFAERAEARARMVREQLEARDIRDPQVLAAMGRVPRHAFMPLRWRPVAYDDHPAPIGHAQTISQPYIVAYMTQALGLEATDRVLEIGTGSGYQAAVLAELVREVYTIEIVAPLGVEARKVLTSLGYDTVRFRIGDGYQGWREAAPFDAIIVTAAPGHVPQPLVDQLAVGGRLVIPVGEGHQELLVLEKRADGVVRKSAMPVRFVPMTGEAQRTAPPDGPAPPTPSDR